MKKIYLAAILIFLTQSFSYAQPIARFATVDHDLGNVSDTDTMVEDVFEFLNTGSQDLRLEKIIASSGNIKAVASSGLVKPGEKGLIRVQVDMRGRKGIFLKKLDVHTNDPITPVTTLSVKIVVKDQIHMSQYKAAEIFTGDCRRCHVDEGQDKTGWDLFKADCFMCHNAGKKTSLTTMSKQSAKEVMKAIRDGVDNTLMPGFDQKDGGPLNEAQIKSLMDLIAP